MNEKIDVIGLSCPTCGAPVNPKDKDCPYCGTALMFISTATIFSKDIATNVLDASLSKWKDLLKQDPNNAQANYSLGIIYMHKKLRDAAISYLKKAVEAEPEFALGHFNLSIALFNDGNVLVNSTDYADCIKEMGYAESTDPSLAEAQAFRHFYLAKKLSGFDNTEAIKEYKAAIDTCPQMPIFHNNIGLCYHKTGRNNEAEQSFKKAIELDPDFTMAYANLCNLYFGDGRYNEGIIEGEKGIEKISGGTLDSYKALLYNNYSLCLWKAKRKDEAIKNIKMAIAYNPTDQLFASNLKTIQAGCFIATATMGSYDHPDVLKLRQFRDNWILTKKYGPAFVDWYYHYGAMAAKYVERNIILKKLSYLFIVKPLVIGITIANAFKGQD